ncbi:BrnT family toxin (plasmid) [Thiomicrospira sp. R3]|uniref:BrnT family toxin n=1 Tax=Thiomicrospira sp. R3 TaxID=3035472 RepID=UPI00259BB7FF|nr:BrnT family toxin [Thiomicrospira sp. R3]WFE69821.1 BrnT family toxin [Thiomicrospira sp. R3]WFE69833.1 BrnT family toxin [Thiomicrospira sp. R3]
MNIEYDERKAQTNVQKHGVSFEEAQTALYDPFALVLEDGETIDEERFLLVGRSEKSRVLLVVYAYRQEDIIRIISARKATNREKVEYEKGI